MNMDKERKEITAAAAQTVPEAVTGAQPQQPVNFRSEKIYTVYQTKDGRMQLKVCYATSTAWLLKEGELVSTERDVTLAGVGGVVAALEEEGFLVKIEPHSGVTGSARGAGQLTPSLVIFRGYHTRHSPYVGGPTPPRRPMRRRLFHQRDLYNVFSK